MRKLGLIAGLGLIILLACGTQNEDEAFIAQHQDALAVFTTQNGVQTMKASQLPSTFSFEKVRAFYPVVCLDLDSDHDGIPDSFDLHFDGSPRSVNPSALPHPCHRCNRGPGVNGDFRYHLKGNDVDLQRGRVSQLGNGQLTIPSPDGPLTVTWTQATELRDWPAGPGAEVRVRGTLTGPNTISADLIWVLCPGASIGTPDGTPTPGTPDGTPTPGTPDGTPTPGTDPGGTPTGTPTDPNAGGTTPGIQEGPGPLGTPTGTPTGTPDGTATGGSWPSLTPDGRLDPTSPLPPQLQPMPTTDGPGSAPYL